MNHEDMFRLHLAGIGEYKGNELIIDKNTSVEFIDGMNEYIIYDYWANNRLYSKSECSHGKVHGLHQNYYSGGELYSTVTMSAGKRNGKNIDYYLSGRISAIRNWVNDRLHGEYVVYHYDGSFNFSHNYTHGIIDDS